MGIISNEKIGREIEGIIAQKLNGVVSPSRINPFDIETLTSLIEVKSCRLRTKGHKNRVGQYLQKGRFVINLNSHAKLRAEAERLEKKAEYTFVLYSFKDSVKIVGIKQMLLEEVETLLSKKGNRYTRKDGMHYVIIEYPQVGMQNEFQKEN